MAALPFGLSARRGQAAWLRELEPRLDRWRELIQLGEAFVMRSVHMPALPNDPQGPHPRSVYQIYVRDAPGPQLLHIRGEHRHLPTSDRDEEAALAEEEARMARAWTATKRRSQGKRSATANGNAGATHTGAARSPSSPDEVWRAVEHAKQQAAAAAAAAADAQAPVEVSTPRHLWRLPSARSDGGVPTPPADGMSVDVCERAPTALDDEDMVVDEDADVDEEEQGSPTPATKRARTHQHRSDAAAAAATAEPSEGALPRMRYAPGRRRYHLRGSANPTTTTTTTLPVDFSQPHYAASVFTDTTATATTATATTALDVASQQAGVDADEYVDAGETASTVAGTAAAAAAAAADDLYHLQIEHRDGTEPHRHDDDDDDATLPTVGPRRSARLGSTTARSSHYDDDGGASHQIRGRSMTDAADLDGWPRVKIESLADDHDGGEAFFEPSRCV